MPGSGSRHDSPTRPCATLAWQIRIVTLAAVLLVLAGASIRFGGYPVFDGEHHPGVEVRCRRRLSPTRTGNHRPDRSIAPVPDRVPA